MAIAGVPTDWETYLDPEVLDLMNRDPQSVVGAECWKHMREADKYLTQVHDRDRMAPYAFRHAAALCATLYFG